MTVTYRIQSKGSEYFKIQIMHCDISFSFRSVALLGKMRMGHDHKRTKGNHI
jgi:hypothetical protein